MNNNWTIQKNEGDDSFPVHAYGVFITGLINISVYQIFAWIGQHGHDTDRHSSSINGNVCLIVAYESILSAPVSIPATFWN